MILDAPPLLLSIADWRERSAAHRRKAEHYTTPARRRRDRGLPHPVEDFLFEYYPFSFAFLEKWHPGVGVGLEWHGDSAPPAPPSPFSGRCYAMGKGQVMAAPSQLRNGDRERLIRISRLLEATRDRAPNFACHGLHEWAMVYRGREIRHEKILSLRLPQKEIDAVVENRAICCSHHDAFRFFTPEARPLNRLQPSLETRDLHEQPGCLHANMDLYKWAAKAMPWVGSDLLLDCFELAMATRDLDMRASPYDMTPWDRDAVKIETADGRRIYETEQKAISLRAEPLRQRLIDGISKTLAAES